MDIVSINTVRFRTRSVVRRVTRLHVLSIEVRQVGGKFCSLILLCDEADGLAGSILTPPLYESWHPYEL